MNVSHKPLKLISHLLHWSQDSDLKAVNCHCQNCFHSKSIISRLNLRNTHFWWSFLLHFQFDRLHPTVELKGMENWIIYCCQVFWAAVEPSGTVIVGIQSHFPHNQALFAVRSWRGNSHRRKRYSCMFRTNVGGLNLYFRLHSNSRPHSAEVFRRAKICVE